MIPLTSPFRASRRPLSTLALACMAFTCSVSASAAQPAAGARYVAMGSSYAAGPGVGQKDASGGNCDRSLNNYAHQVADAWHLDLHDVSCSGATTDNILTHAQNGFAPQIEAVTATTELVTVLIGGNDIGYIKNMLGKSCHNEAVAAGNTSKKCPVFTNDEVAQRITALPNKLTNVIHAIRQRAPKATVVLVNYLPLLSERDSCAGIPLSAGDKADLLKTYKKLATIEKRVAAEQDAVFIAAAHIGEGHEACSDHPYTTVFHPAASTGWGGPVAYHPTQAGMNAVAAAITQTLSEK